jgi:hypothetical protein
VFKSQSHHKKGKKKKIREGGRDKRSPRKRRHLSPANHY